MAGSNSIEGDALLAENCVPSEGARWVPRWSQVVVPRHGQRLKPEGSGVLLLAIS